MTMSFELTTTVGSQRERILAPARKQVNIATSLSVFEFEFVKAATFSQAIGSQYLTIS
jgi:hypothetical protein